MDLGIVMMVLSIVWFGSEAILSRVKRSLPSDERFDNSSLRILWGTIAVSVTLGIFTGNQNIGYFGGGSLAFPIAGCIMIALGMLLRWFAIFSLKRQFTVDVAITKDHRIIQEGVYRFVRHPAYAGSILSFLGLALSFANVISFIIIFLPICSAFLYRIRVEERTLVAAFGDEYIRYTETTKRLIPRIY
jgi:protein-S-isoprenylcysteine O-methyltransferase Ste14